MDMTFREKLAQEHPESINDHYDGGCYGCPYEYGYELPWKRPCGGEFATIGCRACWDREIPMTPEEQEEHDREINAEIIRGYCKEYDTKPCNKCPAYTPCYRGVGTWGANLFPTSAERQRAILDAFEAALPPLDDAPAEAAPQEIPQAARKLVEGRIKELTERVKALEAERDALRDWLNGVGT